MRNVSQQLTPSSTTIAEMYMLRVAQQIAPSSLAPRSLIVGVGRQMQYMYMMYQLARRYLPAPIGNRKGERFALLLIYSCIAGISGDGAFGTAPLTIFCNSSTARGSDCLAAISWMFCTAAILIPPPSWGCCSLSD